MHLTWINLYYIFSQSERPELSCKQATAHPVLVTLVVRYDNVQTGYKALLFCRDEWSWFIVKDELSLTLDGHFHGLISFTVLLKVFINFYYPSYHDHFVQSRMILVICVKIFPVSRLSHMSMVLFQAMNQSVAEGLLSFRLASPWAAFFFPDGHTD